MVIRLLLTMRTAGPAGRFSEWSSTRLAGAVLVLGCRANGTLSGLSTSGMVGTLVLAGPSASFPKVAISGFGGKDPSFDPTESAGSFLPGMAAGSAKDSGLSGILGRAGGPASSLVPENG